jgi:hypothetical protein
MDLDVHLFLIKICCEASNIRVINLLLLLSVHHIEKSVK